MKSPDQSRREVLHLLGGLLAAVPLAACGGAASSTSRTGSSSAPNTVSSSPTTSSRSTGTVASSAVSASTGTSPTTAAATAPAVAGTKVVFLSRGSAEYQDVFKQSIATFQQLHPEITVDNQPVTGNFDEKLSTLLAGNVAPDAFFGQAATFLVYPIKGATIALDSYAAKGVDFKTSDYYPYWLKTMQWRGKLVALPYDPGMVVLFYNKTLLDKAGLPYPDAKSAVTWDKLLTMAEQLTVDNKGNRGSALDPSQVVQYGLDSYSARMWWHLPREHGIDIFSGDFSKTTLDQQAAIDGLQTLVDLSAKYHVVPGGSTGNGPAINFQSDNLAMVITGGWQVGLYREQVKSAWDIAPLPQVAGKPAVGMGWASGLMITKQSKQADAGWQFLTYLAGKQGQQLLLKVGVSQPMLTSMADDPAFTASAEPAHRDVLLNEVAAGDPPPYIPAYMEIQTAVQSDLLNPTLTGKENLQTAIATVVPKINAILAKYKQQYAE
jgi:multiple sugar transport system substrate-binding protein